MGTAEDILRSFVVEATRDAISWAVGKVRDKVKHAGIAVDDRAIEAMLLAELTALDVTMRAMSASVSRDIDKLAESERAFREAPNVTVVDDIDEE